MLGIDISDKSVKVVQLANDKSRRLLAHCAAAMPDGALDNGEIIQPKIVREVLLATLKQCRLSAKISDTAVASIPETQSFLRVIEIPAMREDEISEAVQWEVAQHIPFGLENVYIDWQDLAGPGHRPTDGKREVQVGAAQKKVVDALYGVLQTLDVDIAAFELESQATARALISSELRGKQGILIIDLGGSATNVVIHDHGAMRFTASLHKGMMHLAARLPREEGMMVATKLGELSPEEEQHLAEVAMPALEELAVEIKGIVEFYNSIDAQHEVREIVLTGGGSSMPALNAVLLRHFDNVHVEQGNPWVNILSGGKRLRLPISLKESTRFTTAIGLALRPVVI